MSSDLYHRPSGEVTRKRVKRRPARRQVTEEEAASFKAQPKQSGETFNIWFHKWAGGDSSQGEASKEKAKTRCKISTDAGYTRADGGNSAYCCVFFARGCCPNGSDCTWLHRLPPPSSQLPDTSLDIFGREKHAQYRDDMGGVGSFTRQNRTLYIGRMKETRDSEEVVERHFQEWGEIEKLRVLTGRGVAFVTYVSELSAQFAKEAMMHQSLDNEEVLNVRWATEDPNPTAKVAEHARLVELGETGIAARLDPALVQAVRQMDELEGIADAQEDDEEENDGDDAPPAKRLRAQPTSEIPPARPSAVPALPQPVNVPKARPGLISANALSSLQQVSKLKTAPPKETALAAFADYGSDED